MKGPKNKKGWQQMLDDMAKKQRPVLTKGHLTLFLGGKSR